MQNFMPAILFLSSLFPPNEQLIYIVPIQLNTFHAESEGQCILLASKGEFI